MKSDKVISNWSHHELIQTWKRKSSDEEYIDSGQPIKWKNKAEELKITADLVADYENKNANSYLTKILQSNDEKIKLDIAQPLFEIFIFISGLAIENLLKGIILTRKPEYLKDGKLHKKLQSHDLKHLSHLANVKLSDEEMNFCNLATDFISSIGRYPIPLSKDQMFLGYSVNRNIQKIINILYIKLRKLLE